MSPKTRIALTADYHSQEMIFWKQDLLNALCAHNIEVVPLLECGAPIEKIIAETSGLIIPGGLDDVDTERYGEKVAHGRVRVCKKRTDFEFKVLDVAMKNNDYPILPICWGLQVTNVFLGGSLIQHLPDDKIKHEQVEPSTIATHWVNLDSKGVVSRALSTQRILVNSTHHQAIGRLGRGLIIEGRADDNVVEIVTMPSRRFLWGVQWHPERLKGDPILPYFLKQCSLIQ